MLSSPHSLFLYLFLHSLKCCFCFSCYSFPSNQHSSSFFCFSISISSAFLFLQPYVFVLYLQTLIVQFHTSWAMFHTFLLLFAEILSSKFKLVYYLNYYWKNKNKPSYNTSPIEACDIKYPNSDMNCNVGDLCILHSSV